MKGLETNSKEYKELWELYQKAEAIENAADVYCQKLIKGLFNLIEPARRINISNIRSLSNNQIIALGKAARLLNTEMKKNGVSFRL